MYKILPDTGMREIGLDAKERRLLFALDFNARATLSELAKEVGMSKQGVEYKLKSLIKRGVIRGFYPVINLPKLGYLYCRLLITLQNVTRAKRKEIIAYLQEHRRVFWLFEMQGMFDLLVAVWVKSITEFREFKQEVEERFGEHLKRSVATITTDVIYYQNRYFVGTTQTKEIHVAETMDRISVDDIDRAILRVLCESARMPLVEIAAEVGVSAKVVAYRIARMEKLGLIAGYRPIIDHNLLGYTYYKLFINLYNISKEALKALRMFIKSSPVVIYEVEGIGLPGDLDIEVMVKSNAELFDFINSLRFKFPKLVGDYTPVIFMDTLKVKYLPF